jgi:hypothetical protein
MIFKQYKDGSCDILFADEEVKFINKQRKLHLSDEAIRHFGNHLLHIITQWQMNFNEKTKNLVTHENEEVIPDLKKE